MSITEWPTDQRPREKLIRLGAHALSDAELLAVFLRVGVPGKTAVALGQEMLQQFGSLHALLSATLEQFNVVRGVGPAKFAQLQAVLEMARRTLHEDLRAGITLNNPSSVRNYLTLLLGSRPFESFVVLYLDVKLRLLACEELFRGSLAATRVYPREIIRSALRHNAAAAILAHNHPSGDVQPSQADIELTTSLSGTFASVDVNLVDHFIVAGNTCFAFSEHGLIKNSSSILNC